MRTNPVNPIPIAIHEKNDAMEHFLRLCHRRRYPAKVEIMQPGDMGDTLYYITEGSVSISMKDTDGQEIILAYLNKGEFIGEIGVFLGGETRGVTVKTRTQCQLAEINYSRLDRAMSTELHEHAIELYKTLGRQLSHRLQQASRKVSHLAFLDVTGRIAKTLIDLCEEPDAMTHPDGMQIRITRQEIGRIVGCSREMAGRVLKNLETEGLLTAKGKTIVVFGTR